MVIANSMFVAVSSAPGKPVLIAALPERYIVDASIHGGNNPGGRGGNTGPAKAGQKPRGNHGTARRSGPEAPCYGALDLGTNNCRLLLARPTERGFVIVDAFSRIVRLERRAGQFGASQGRRHGAHD